MFIWGPPGKSTLVQQFAESLGTPCVFLLGSQLAPEDIIGVPQIRNGLSQNIYICLVLSIDMLYCASNISNGGVLDSLGEAMA